MMKLWVGILTVFCLGFSLTASARPKVIDLDQYDLNTTVKGIALNFSVKSQPVGGGVHTIHQIPGGGAIDQCAGTQTDVIKRSLDNATVKSGLKSMGIASVSVLLATDSGEDTTTNCTPDAAGKMGSYFVRATMTTDGKCNTVSADKIVKDLAEVSGVCARKGGKLTVKVAAPDSTSGSAGGAQAN